MVDLFTIIIKEYVVLSELLPLSHHVRSDDIYYVHSKSKQNSNN